MKQFKIQLFIKLLKGVTFLCSLIFLSLFIYFNQIPNEVDAALSPQRTFTIPTLEGFNQTVTTEGISESLSSSGLYTVTFKIFANPNQNKPASFNLTTELHRCKEGNGNIQPQMFCGENGFIAGNTLITLNAENNYTTTITLMGQQTPTQPCGSFQADLKVPSQSETLGFSIYRTGMDCPSPTPIPTMIPTPLPTQMPTPHPTYTPHPLPTQRPTPQPSYPPTPKPSHNSHCPLGFILKRNYAHHYCEEMPKAASHENENNNNNQKQQQQDQNQKQNQSQSQTNTQEQSVNVTTGNININNNVSVK